MSEKAQLGRVSLAPIGRDVPPSNRLPALPSPRDYLPSIFYF